MTKLFALLCVVHAAAGARSWAPTSLAAVPAPAPALAFAPAPNAPLRSENLLTDVWNLITDPLCLFGCISPSSPPPASSTGAGSINIAGNGNSVVQTTTVNTNGGGAASSPPPPSLPPPPPPLPPAVAPAPAPGPSAAWLVEVATGQPSWKLVPSAVLVGAPLVDCAGRALDARRSNLSACLDYCAALAACFAVSYNAAISSCSPKLESGWGVAGAPGGSAYALWDGARETRTASRPEHCASNATYFT